MQSHNEFPFTRSSAPFVFRSDGKTPVQRVQIDFKNENSIEEIDETVEIPGTATKERGCMILVGHQSANLIDIPDMMLVAGAVQRLTGFWVALIG